MPEKQIITIWMDAQMTAPNEGVVHATWVSPYGNPGKLPDNMAVGFGPTRLSLLDTISLLRWRACRGLERHIKLAGGDATLRFGWRYAPQGWELWPDQPSPGVLEVMGHHLQTSTPSEWVETQANAIYASAWQAKPEPPAMPLPAPIPPDRVKELRIQAKLAYEAPEDTAEGGAALFSEDDFFADLVANEVLSNLLLLDQPPKEVLP